MKPLYTCTVIGDLYALKGVDRHSLWTFGCLKDFSVQGGFLYRKDVTHNLATTTVMSSLFPPLYTMSSASVAPRE